jgi:hypothetical protein
MEGLVAGNLRSRRDTRTAAFRYAVKNPVGTLDSPISHAITHPLSEGRLRLSFPGQAFASIGRKAQVAQG